ncbi:gamma-glutamyltransferase 1 Threonine peptidase. MEROPS family T03 [Tistlia consotensis]|uniref:Glutathione hydrolase proenzyme n=1 Tax=Tistlia consotensis USBA 355 TaxID=560819 RepID=A0A1Y6B761_9PROT|nr:gamma-glutamyltransferase [Tistlia consotensis]SME93865.1 gamma-glutamyltransferase 1 Threonine peptidase. MEROPS family T03 [Tistlia consotensis USBA 355]SNR28882.1 gamma-glutamyltransferase 1 Threonine peptidase. MEROPS family T03 [Tistlia consotensis]
MAHRFLLLLLLALAPLCLDAAPASARSGKLAAGMVAAANPRAAEAGMAILRQGGSAMDAAVAIQAMLGLVEPQSSGIGGGAFLLYWDAAAQKLHAYDGRETAPAADSPDQFLHADGTPMDFYEAVVGGLAVGVPGVPRLLELAHRNHGKLPWAGLFQPAIALAREGFQVSPRLAMEIAEDPYLNRFDTPKTYFYRPDGSPKQAGDRLVNEPYAETLEALAGGGADAFYKGRIAEDIVKTVRAAPGDPGRMTAADLAGYQARERDPLCSGYRSYKVCGMPPPTSGGIAVLQMLGILENFQLGKEAPNSLDAVHLMAEAGRLAFADRNAYVADSDFVPVPVARLLDKTYLRKRAALVERSHSLGVAEPGQIKQKAAVTRQYEPPSTTHFVVVDAAGNVVSMTSSVENAFGSRLMVDGFILNNQLTDFSFVPQVDEVAVANRVEPGKRPRSSMSPTIVFDDEGRFFAATGSPGGSAIIGYVLQDLIALIDWHLTAQQAVALPHVVNRNGVTDLEAGTALSGDVQALTARGHEVRLRPLVSGLHTIRRVEGVYDGGADPRREGVVLAE